MHLEKRCINVKQVVFGDKSFFKDGVLQVSKQELQSNSFSNADPNRLVPVDSMRTLEKEGVIGKLHI